MRFLCQASIPPGFAGEQRMAYVFMTDDGDFVDGTWEPDGGENAVILQPAPFHPIVETKPLSTGPTLQRAVDRGWVRTFEDVEVHAEPVDLLEPEDDGSDPKLSRYMGEPEWLQSEETPPGDCWQFLLQIDSATDRYELAFGDLGVGYVFVSRDGTSARFLYQCC